MLKWDREELNAKIVNFIDETFINETVIKNFFSKIIGFFSIFYYFFQLSWIISQFNLSLRDFKRQMSMGWADRNIRNW